VWTSEADELWAKVRADEPIVTPAPAADQPADDAATDAPPASEGDDAPVPDTASDEPAPVQTKEAGKEAFSAADETAQCG
ncbi:hypothetical protein ACNJFI_21275, partial [Mycobacterium tuberculosis]